MSEQFTGPQSPQYDASRNANHGRQPWEAQPVTPPVNAPQPPHSSEAQQFTQPLPSYAAPVPPQQAYSAAQGAVPAQPGVQYPGATPRPRTNRNTDPNFFAALLDFNFTNFISIKFAKVLYIIGIALNVLGWLGGAIVWFIVAGVADEGGFVVLGVLQLLFGWIPVIINVIVFRVVLELVIAQVRTAQNTTKLVAATEE